MKNSRQPKDKIIEPEKLAVICKVLREQGWTVVFTNGCFDLLHSGHVHLLQKAREAGDVLIVGLNSDESIRGLKGPMRPIMPQTERCQMIASFECVNYVVVFDEPDPHEIISRLRPGVLVKGGDWEINTIIGRDIVEADGGRVLRIDRREGLSTTNIIEKVSSLRQGEKMYEAKKTWNSKLIITLGAIASVTAMACAGVITGGVALPAIAGLATAYTGYRHLTK